MRLEETSFGQQDYGSYATLLRESGLLPDIWLKSPHLLPAAIEGSKFWLIYAGRRVVGLVWLSEIQEGVSANLNIILKKRRYMRPRRVNLERIFKNPVRPRKVTETVFDEVFSYGFNDLDLKRITAPIPRSRRAAIGMARRYGFTDEGACSDAVMCCGKLDDLMIFGYTQRMYERQAARRQYA